MYIDMWHLINISINISYEIERCKQR